MLVFSLICIFIHLQVWKRAVRMRPRMYAKMKEIVELVTLGRTKGQEDVGELPEAPQFESGPLSKKAVKSRSDFCVAVKKRHQKMVINRKKLTKTTVSAMFTGTDVAYKYMLADQIIAGNLSICGAKNDVVDMCLLVGKVNKVFLFPCMVCVSTYLKH
jgi:hypothetical protein